MSRFTRRAPALAAACLFAAALPARADVFGAPLTPSGDIPNSTIFDPLRAPEIIIKIGVKRLVLTPSIGASSTTISSRAIENKPNSTSFSSIITSSVAGAAAAPSGEIHIRGSHGQYSYYLDGAPLPSNVSGSFSDLINPKSIETLRVYTGGFPAEYGGQLAAIFDVTAKAGQTGRPSGYLQQYASGYNTYQTATQIGGGSRDLSYFVSGIRSSTDIRLSPLTQTPLHDSGLENVGFGKFDYQSGINDRITLDTGVNGAMIQVPNEPDRQAVGQNDIQKENGSFANLIWHHHRGLNSLVLAFYSHNSQLRYNGSPQDLVPSVGSADTSQLTTTFENQKATYKGVRADYIFRATRDHKVQIGFDVDTVTGHQSFNSFGVPQSDPAQNQPTIVDDHSLSGGDRSVYAQDDWTVKRLLINYGARYDVHQADITTSQLSPRLNLTYTAGRRDRFHGFYDRLFQPIAIEDIVNVGPAGTTAPFQPERDDFFEAGWEHKNAGTTLTLDAYYRNEKNAIDDQTYQNTQIDIPINFAKGYTRGIEFGMEGPLTKDISYYANYARSWAQGAGPIIGGLIGGAPLGYFYDDHDQTHTASLGLSYETHGHFATLDGEYGSGFPYGEIDNAQGNPVTINYLRVPPHFTFDLGLGMTLKTIQAAFTINNILNYAYIIKQASAFSDREWAPGRTFGIKITANF